MLVDTEVGAVVRRKPPLCGPARIPRFVQRKGIYERNEESLNDKGIERWIPVRSRTHHPVVSECDGEYNPVKGATSCPKKKTSS